MVKIADNIGWLTGEKLLRMGVGMVVLAWTARYLGPEQFGLLSFVTAFVALFGAIAALGLPQVVVRDLVREPDCAHEILGTAAFLQLAGGFAAYLVALTSIVFLRPDEKFVFAMVAVFGCTLLLEASKITCLWFESQVQSKYTVLAQTSAFLVCAAAKVALILLHAPLIAFVWAALAEAVLVALVLLDLMSKHGPSLVSLRVTGGRVWALLKASFPLFFAGLAITIYMKIDLIMLAKIVGDEAVGVYSAATRISELWYFIPGAVVASVFPAIIESKENSEAQFYRRLQKLFDLMVFISVMVAVPVSLFSAHIVILIFGDAYVAAGPVLSLHIWAAVFVFLGGASSKWFLAENKEMLILQRASVGAIANVVLNLWLIPDFGVSGAACATLISYALADLVADAFHRSTWDIFKMKIKSLNLFSAYSRLL